jgi:endoglucanase
MCAARTIHFDAVPVPSLDDSLRLLREVGSEPTAPFHEDAPRRAIEGELRRLGVEPRRDGWGNVLATRGRGDRARPVALVAHMDHPGFEVVEARGTSARARVRGGLFRETFRPPVAVAICRDGELIRAQGSDLTRDVEPLNYSIGVLRLEAERPLLVGDWGILDLPPFERSGDDVRMRAADDLAGCALILAVLAGLGGETRPHECYAVFTRAEEPGLFGARLIAEERGLPADVVIVSIETSRELPGAVHGRGPVIRVGDYHHTFDDAAESYLRAAAERIAPTPTQRMLMYGGTCEASAFIDAGYAATAIALPLRNYHNAGERGPAPEIISLADFQGAAALLHETVVAAGAGAAESYRASTGTVPEEIRRLLR